MTVAREVMNPHVVAVKEDTTIDEAIQLLVDLRISGLPVVGADGKLVGIISEKDALRLLREVSDRPRTVSEFMTKSVVSFEPGADLMAICDTLASRNFRRVPIVEGGKLVGIVSRRDIISYIIKLRKKVRKA